jgi:RNA polymerase sigma-70 factor (ECF subfamily)
MSDEPPIPTEAAADGAADASTAESAAEDVALMQRAARDDLDAFSALVRKHERPLANFFARNGVHRDVEDLAQQTFLKLWRVRHGYRPTAKFTTFLYLLARQVLIDAARAAQRRAGLHERAGAEMDPVEPAPAMRGEGGDAEAALACLSPALRETIVLVVMQGLAYREAAEALGVPVGTVKSRVNAALAQMKEFLSR